MLKAEIIQESDSPWGSPVLMLDKQDGTTRMCIDYRKLNQITISDPFPLPRIDDIIDRISEKQANIFTTIELKSGYWQVAMTEDSIQKTAFTTPSGHYEFRRLTFGLKNAPAEFCRMMSRIF